MKKYCYYPIQLKGRNTIMVLFSYETKIINDGVIITDPRVRFSGLHFLDYKGINVSKDKTHLGRSAKYDAYYYKFNTIGINASDFINNKARMFEAESDEDAIKQIKLLKELGEIK